MCDRSRKIIPGLLKRINNLEAEVYKLEAALTDDRSIEVMKEEKKIAEEKKKKIAEEKKMAEEKKIHDQTCKKLEDLVKAYHRRMVICFVVLTVCMLWIPIVIMKG